MLVPMGRRCCACSGSCEEAAAVGGADTRRRATDGPIGRRRCCSLNWQTNRPTTKTKWSCCCCCRRPTSRTNKFRRVYPVEHEFRHEQLHHEHVTRTRTCRTCPIRREDRQGDQNHEVQTKKILCRRDAAGVWSLSGQRTGVKVLPSLNDDEPSFRQVVRADIFGGRPARLVE